VDVVGLAVEDRREGVGRLHQIAFGGMQDPLRLAGGAGGVRDEERVLTVEGERHVLRRGIGRRLMPPHGPAVDPGDLLPRAPDDQHVTHLRAALQGGVHRGLEGGGRTAPVATVGGDHHHGVEVQDPAAQRVGAEATEDDRVRRTDPGAGQHGDHGLGNHRQVDDHPVVGPDAEPLERVGRAAHVLAELPVGDRPLVAGLADEVQGPVAVPVLHMLVDTVVGHVEAAVDEPARERRIRPVQHLARRCGPAEPAGFTASER
jgi:hypothetical protein